MDYEVDHGLLARAGDKAASLAEDLTATLSDMHLDGVAAAVPGGLTASAAERVHRSWTSGSGEVSEACSRYADDVAACADAYRAVEEQAAEAVERWIAGWS